MDKEAETKKAFYIIKPANNACGRGIRVIHKDEKIPKGKHLVVCKYVHKPHLINDFKYDCRIYVMVTSYDPLKIYLYHNGLVRFTTQKYTSSKKFLKKRFIHLTNYSV
jgi:tubulin polyglutamylase TTLL4